MQCHYTIPGGRGQGEFATLRKICITEVGYCRVSDEGRTKKLGTSDTHCERVQEEFQEIEMIQIRPVISANKVFVVISYVK